MAILRIEEFSAGGIAGLQAVHYPAVVVQSLIDFTDGAVHQSQAFSDQTRILCLTNDSGSACVVKPGGKNPVVTINDGRMEKGQTKHIWVDPGDKLSVQSVAA